MLEIRQTQTFVNWFQGLKDRAARARIQARIDRMSMGNFGDVSPVGGGVSELRLHYGPGYRIYFVQHERVVFVLLSGGDKSSQKADIKKAKALADQLEN